ncbi:MAG: EAL domain-containing protein [Syntrophorhabdales bacterium]|jgi:diguanylate cyclase (GGDEF)-like protein
MGRSVEGSKKPTVLIVDDEVAARLVTGEALLNAGFAVEEAEDGAVALRIFEQLKPDIVIADVMMPIMDGFALCEEIRRKPGGKLLPVLMVTALDDIESIHRAYEVGATDFITKPFNWLVLAQRIRHMVRESKLIDDLSRSEAKNRALLSAIPDAMFRISNDGTILESRVSKDFDLADARSQVTGKKLYETLPPHIVQNAMKAMENALNKGTTENLEYQLILDGTVRYFEARVVGSGQNETLSIVRDVTDRRRAQDQLLRDALYDPLTGLANRSLLMDRLEQSLGRVKRSKKETFAILFLDLDRFKNVNDTLGHIVGDKVLTGIGQKLQSCVRPGDTVARLGGDEFVILLENVVDLTTATMITERIECSLSQPMSLDGHDIVMLASIGIVVASDDYEKPEDVLRNADIAVYQAKAMGRGYHVIFDQSMYQNTVALIELESELRRAVERQELFLQYQPVVSLETGSMVSLEALIRWQHPERGVVSPDKFIPLAEDTGLIVAIGEWMLRKACEQISEWQTSRGSSPIVAVNISGHQLKQSDFASVVKQILDEFGLSPECIELELTESVLMDNLEHTNNVLSELRRMGLHLSLDDFGTGYSSLSYLQRFPVQKLKVDRSFIMGLGLDSSSSQIVAAIFQLANVLGLDVVAEGVETSEVASRLREMGCRLAQGFYFAKPSDAESLRFPCSGDETTGTMGEGSSSGTKKRTATPPRPAWPLSL